MAVIKENKIEVSVVIPCLNELETLSTCINKALTAFKEGGFQGEIIVADNGSTDGSQALAESLGVRLIHVKEKGYGNALRGGFKAAKGSIIVMGDADDSYDFLEIPRFVEALREGNDMVLGTRLKGKIMPGAMPFLNRYVGNPVLSKLLNIFFRTGISDAHCGLRAFRRNCLPKMTLEAQGMELASEMVVKAALADLKLHEIPITLYKDGRNRKPHLRPFKDGWRHLKFLLTYSPMYLFFFPGFILLLTGLLPLVIIAWKPIWVGHSMFNTHTAVFFSSMTLIGYQILNLGIFAKTIARFEDRRKYDHIMNIFHREFTLEKGLILGLSISIPGLAILLYLIGLWVLNNFQDIKKINMAVFATTILILGIQTIFSSFFLTILMEEKKIKPF